MTNLPAVTLTDLEVTQRHLDALSADYNDAVARRNRLIRQGIAEGLTREAIARATGLAVSRVNQIARGWRAT